MSLRECYDGAKGLVAEVDTFEVVNEVDRYRELWRPDEVSVILLAESHVRTSLEDFAHQWSYGNDSVHHGNYVRFVYCLANGERNLVNTPSNRGTWQFWKILFSCLNPVLGNKDFAPILKSSTPDFTQRIKNKIQLLSSLKKAGIWLMDASIVGVNGLDTTTKDRILRYCWKRYTGPRMENLEPLSKHLIVIGAGVGQTLKDEIERLGIEYTVIPQPQAHLAGGYSEYYQRCFEICSRFRN